MWVYACVPVCMFRENTIMTVNLLSAAGWSWGFLKNFQLLSCNYYQTTEDPVVPNGGVCEHFTATASIFTKRLTKDSFQSLGLPLHLGKY